MSTTQEQYLEASHQPDSVGFRVIEREDLSLQALNDMVQAGEAVMRSPHVGNLTMYNCALAAAGVRLILHDRTIPDRDTSYNPGYVIEGGNATSIIASEDTKLFSTHVHTTTAVNNSAAGALLATAHRDAVREAFPQTHVQTMSEFLLTHAAEVHEMVTVLSERGFGDWKRRVDTAGIIHDVEGDPLENIARYGIFRSGHDRTDNSGMILPNLYNTFLLGTLDALDRRTSQVTHLAGSSMAGYIKRFTHELDGMYQTVMAKTTLAKRLPSQLTFAIVPSTAARLAIPADQQSHLDSLLEQYKTYRLVDEKLAAERREIATSTKWSPSERKREQSLKQTEHSRHRDSLASIVEAHRSIFASSGERTHATHYDLLAARRAGHESGLYIPYDDVYCQKLGELAAWQKPLLQAQKGRKSA